MLLTVAVSTVVQGRRGHGPFGDSVIGMDDLHGWVYPPNFIQPGIFKGYTNGKISPAFSKLAHLGWFWLIGGRAGPGENHDIDGEVVAGYLFEEKFLGQNTDENSFPETCLTQRRMQAI